QERIFGVQLGHRSPAPARLLLVEGLLSTPFAKRDDIHRLEELVVIPAHEALAAVEDFDLHALELEPYLVELGALRLVDCRRQHVHLTEGKRIEDRHPILVAKGLLGGLRGSMFNVGRTLLDGEYAMVEACLLYRGRAARASRIIGVPVDL